jgi:hypothetical protein
MKPRTKRNNQSLDTNDSSFLTTYIKKKLRQTKIFEIDLRSSFLDRGEAGKDINSYINEVFLSLCKSEITRITLSFNLLFGGVSESNKYIAMKCTDGFNIIMLIKTAEKLIFAKGDPEISRLMVDKLLENLKFDIIESETLIKLCQQGC